MHLVARIAGERYEIQLRTRLQHAWAEVAERLAGRFGQALKYGGGDDVPREFLKETSSEIAELENIESLLFSAWSGTTLTDAELDAIVMWKPGGEINETPEEKRAFQHAVHDDYEDPAVHRILYRIGSE